MSRAKPCPKRGCVSCRKKLAAAAEERQLFLDQLQAERREHAAREDNMLRAQGEDLLQRILSKSFQQLGWLIKLKELIEEQS